MTLWCRVFHVRAWTTRTRPEENAGRVAWIRCGRCGGTMTVRISIPAPGPVGKTPVARVR